MVWHGSRVLVTGASGFIGSRLTGRLRELGAAVHPVGRTPAGPGWHLADLRDAEAVERLVREVAPDVVFHLASAVTGTREPAMVLPIMQANLTSVVNLLTAVQCRPGTRVVLAGSIEEPRTGEPSPSSPYAVAKWAAEGYARLYHHLWQVRVCNLRIAMVYGPGQRDMTKLLPYVTTALLRGERPRLTSGTRLLDWVYVDDVVEAFLAAAESEHSSGKSFEIGSGKATSIRDTVAMVARIIERPFLADFGALPERPLDSARIADLSQAHELLKWTPNTELEQGLRNTITWFLERSR
ncbi:MAG: NAD-dependent epimerase/dehydratase family protein [Nonomuraea sp.]|nr:NAD-dependent epimerase/dehydratase family protein [Nonomuraea sp.]